LGVAPCNTIRTGESLKTNASHLFNPTLYYKTHSFMRLFFTAFVQIFLVAANTVFLARGFVIGMVISSFGINWLWTHNVRKTAFGGERDRIWYASGATLGCLSGYYVSQLFC